MCTFVHSSGMFLTRSNLQEVGSLVKRIRIFLANEISANLDFGTLTYLFLDPVWSVGGPSPGWVCQRSILGSCQVDLRILPNDVHEARKCSYELHFNCHYECTIWIFYQVWFLRHAYCWYFIYHKHPFLCLFFMAIGPNISIGIVACLGQLPAISNYWTDLVLVNIIMRNIHWFLSFFPYKSGDSILGCISCLLEWGSLDEVDILVYSYWPSWLCLAVLPLNLCTLTVFDYFLYCIQNHIDTSQLKTMLCCQLLFVSS